MKKEKGEQEEDRRKRRYHRPKLYTLHFPFNKQVYWFEQAYSATPGLGETEEQPGHPDASSTSLTLNYK